MIQLDGEKELAQPIHQVAEKLTDLNFLIQVIPDVTEVKTVNHDHAELTIRPGFSFLRSALHLSLKKLESSDAKVPRYQVITKGVGSSTTVETSFDLAETASGCVLRWKVGVIELGGLLKAAPKGLIQASAQKVVSDILARLEARRGEG